MNQPGPRSAKACCCQPPQLFHALYISGSSFHTLISIEYPQENVHRRGQNMQTSHWKTGDEGLVTCHHHTSLYTIPFFTTLHLKGTYLRRGLIFFCPWARALIETHPTCPGVTSDQVMSVWQKRSTTKEQRRGWTSTYMCECICGIYSHRMAEKLHLKVFSNIISVHQRSTSDCLNLGVQNPSILLMQWTNWTKLLIKPRRLMK